MMSNITDLIEDALEENEHLRDCDSLLYTFICGRINPLAMNMSFRIIMEDLKAFGLPSIETVTRLRRKIQSERPELRASDQVQEWRSAKEEMARQGMFA